MKLDPRLFRTLYRFFLLSTHMYSVSRLISEGELTRCRSHHNNFRWRAVRVKDASIYPEFQIDLDLHNDPGVYREFHKLFEHTYMNNKKTLSQ